MDTSAENLQLQIRSYAEQVRHGSSSRRMSLVGGGGSSNSIIALTKSDNADTVGCFAHGDARGSHWSHQPQDRLPQGINDVLHMSDSEESDMFVSQTLKTSNESPCSCVEGCQNDFEFVTSGGIPQTNFAGSLDKSEKQCDGVTTVSLESQSDDDDEELGASMTPAAA